MNMPIAVAFAATVLALTAALPAAAAPQHEGTLSYERTGRGTTTLLLIPGLGSGAEVWKDVVADLADRYTIVTVTLDGFDGAAPPSGGASLDADVASLDALISKLKLGKPVVVGHSLGGFLALRLAAEHPGDVAKIVAVDSLPIFPPPQPGETGAGRAAAAHAMAAGLKRADAAAFTAQSHAMAATLVTSPENVEWVSGMTVRSDQAAVADRMEGMMLADLRPALPKIAVLVLVMGAGAAFGVDATKAFYSALYAGTPAVSFEIFGAARHFIMLDQKVQFERTLVAFAPPV
jgi:pimeloyl-ACP methyl ester carboxylesterase